MTPQESGELCLMSCLLGDNRDIFFPKLSEDLHLITFSEIAVKYLDMMGYEAYECSSEDEARELVNTLPEKRQWPCLFTESDTTGEKDFEEFFMDGETLDLDRFQNLGIVKSELNYDEQKLNYFLNKISEMKENLEWNKADLIDLFHELLPDFDHKETGKYLDSKM